MFKKGMPDVNWDHQPLREEMAEVLNYWINKGIDGFRLDAFIYIDIDKEFPEHPEETGLGQDLNAHGEKIQDYLSEMNEAIHHKEDEVFIVGEATSADTELTNWYTEPDKNIVDKIITMHYFQDKEEMMDDSLSEAMQHVPLDFKAFKEVQKSFQEGQKENGGPILYWSNHDMPRSPHKYGNMEEYRNNTAKMMAAMLYLQKGIPIIYYGEEIGMKNIAFDDPSNIEDVGTMDFYKEAQNADWEHNKIMNHINLSARDVSRGIMQWENSETVGFSKRNPWTLYNREATYNVKDQEKDEESILHFYRQLIQLKKTDLFQYGSYEMKETKEEIYSYERQFDGEKAIVYSNFSDKPTTISLNQAWTQEEILLENDNNAFEDGKLQLAPFGTVVFVKE